nr:putative disease resistance protein rga3 [Quercus suber]
MTSEDRERMFGECLGMRAWILNCQGKSQKKLINLVASEDLGNENQIGVAAFPRDGACQENDIDFIRFLDVGFDRCPAQKVEQEIRLVICVDKEIRKLEGNLQTVKAVLNDAEKRQVTEGAVKVWLEKLNIVCYEMEDVVDEWNTELIKSAIQKEEEKKNADSSLVMIDRPQTE